LKILILLSAVLQFSLKLSHAVSFVNTSGSMNKIVTINISRAYRLILFGQ